MSPRYYGPVTSEHLDRLADLAAAERERFVRRCPRYRNRLLAAALAQGAALHMLNGSSGVKDLDVWMFFAAIPGERFPEFPRLVKHADFGPSSLGRQAYDLAAARDERQRRQWARWAEQYRGRRVDLVKRALPAAPGAGPQEAIRSWLRAGLTARRETSAFYLARKPVVLLDPPALRGTFLWRGPQELCGSGTDYWHLSSYTAVNYFFLTKKVYEPKYGQLEAHQFGMTTRIAYIFVFAYFILFFAKHYTTLDTFASGPFWLLLILAFEWIGSFIQRRPVREILEGWHINKGFHVALCGPRA